MGPPAPISTSVAWQSNLRLLLSVGALSKEPRDKLGQDAISYAANEMREKCDLPAVAHAPKLLRRYQGLADHGAALLVSDDNFQGHLQYSLDAALDHPIYLSDCIADMDILESGGDLLATPLYPDWVSPWRLMFPKEGELFSDPDSFWHRWWRGAVSGQWLDWNLQRDIALIPDDIWQQGPKAVAAAIAEIEARHDLLRQVIDLRQQVEVLQEMARAPGAAVAHRGHNHPPELVDLPAAIAEHAAPLLPQLQQAEAELVKPQPNRAVLRKLAGALATFAGAVLRYCGKTADTIVQEGAKVLAIYLAVNPDAVGRVVDGASALAKALTQYLTTFGP